MATNRLEILRFAQDEDSLHRLTLRHGQAPAKPQIRFTQDDDSLRRFTLRHKQVTADLKATNAIRPFKRRGSLANLKVIVECRAPYLITLHDYPWLSPKKELPPVRQKNIH